MISWLLFPPRGFHLHCWLVRPFSQRAMRLMTHYCNPSSTNWRESHRMTKRWRAASNMHDQTDEQAKTKNTWRFNSRVAHSHLLWGTYVTLKSALPLTVSVICSYYCNVHYMLQLWELYLSSGTKGCRYAHTQKYVQDCTLQVKGRENTMSSCLFLSTAVDVIDLSLQQSLGSAILWVTSKYLHMCVFKCDFLRAQQSITDLTKGCCI